MSRADAPREPTVQQLDPVVASAGWSMVAAAAVFSLLVALMDTVVNWDARGPVALVPLTILIIGEAVFVALARLRVHVLRRVEQAGVLALFVVATVVDLGTRQLGFGLPASSWGPLATGIALLALGLYRPPTDLLVSTAASVVVVGGTAAWVARETAGTGVLVVFVVQSAAPIAILGFAGSVFARVSVRMIRLWEQQAEQESRVEFSAMRPGIERSVVQDRISLLNGAVVPLYTSIIESGRITQAHIVAAGEASNGLRDLLVAEADRSWLQRLLETDGTADDPLQRATLVPLPVRPGLRALVNALRSVTGYTAGSLRVSIGQRDPIEVRVQAEGDWGNKRMDRVLGPYLAVLRGETGNLSVDIESASVCVRFTCDASH